MKIFNKKSSEEVEEEILSMVEEGNEQGVIEDNEAEMIVNIFEFSDKCAKDVMTNRQRILGLEDTVTVEEALNFALENSFTRYPIYSGDIDNIVGIVHLRDLIENYMKQPTAKVTDALDDPIFIHPTIGIAKLLNKMQREKIHMAIVVDEYGQTDGIVTMEDIIEEIVGNISDEHDEEETFIRRIKNGDYIIRGDAGLEEVSEALSVEFPDEDIETVNGFMLYMLGRLPKDGEKPEIDYQGYKFIPVKIKDKMIRLVKCIKNEESKKEED